MKAGSRPQYYRNPCIIQMAREGSEGSRPTNGMDFMKESSVSRRTVSWDLEFLRSKERHPLEHDTARHGYYLADKTYALSPVTISRREAFSFGLARKLLAHYEATLLHLDMRSVLDKIAEALEGEGSIEPAWLGEHVGDLPEDRVWINPGLWASLAGFIEHREAIRADYRTFISDLYFSVDMVEIRPYAL